MTPDEARAALRKSITEKFGSDDIEHLIDPQLRKILKKGKGAWNNDIARHYVEVEFPQLFETLGA